MLVLERIGTSLQVHNRTEHSSLKSVDDFSEARSAEKVSSKADDAANLCFH